MNDYDGEQKAEGQIPLRSLVLKLMVLIVDEPRVEKVTTYLRDHFVRFQFACAGEGTANSELLDLLGLGRTEKSILLCLLPDFHASDIMRKISKDLDLERHGTGIAFTMPLSGITNPLLHVFNDEMIEKLMAMIEPERRAHISGLLNIHPDELSAGAVKERMAVLMENNSEKIVSEAVRHELIIAVVNQNASEDVMIVAKAAGARGGTVINARRTGLDDASTFLGMPVQSQKEIIMILTDRTKKVAIMKAINHDFGLTTETRGIVFSLPVDSVAGMHTAQQA